MLDARTQPKIDEKNLFYVNRQQEEERSLMRNGKNETTQTKKPDMRKGQACKMRLNFFYVLCVLYLQLCI